MSKHHKQKTIAVFDLQGNFLNYCSRDSAKKITEAGKGYFVADKTIRLNVKKIGEARARHEVIREAKRKCYICNRNIPKKETATVDHLIPKSRDIFANNKFNMRCSCFRCNNDKADMSLLEYVQHMKENKERYLYMSHKRLTHLEEFAIHYEKEYYGFYIKHIETLGGYYA